MFYINDATWLHLLEAADAQAKPADAPWDKTQPYSHPDTHRFQGLSRLGACWAALFSHKSKEVET